jgi:hypothetical protein
LYLWGAEGLENIDLSDALIQPNLALSLQAFFLLTILDCNKAVARRSDEDIEDLSGH